MGALLSITGTENVITGCAIAGNVEFGLGASACRFAASPIAGGYTFADNSGNATNHADYLFVGSATYDPPSIPDGGGSSTIVTCSGARLGMFARAAFSLDLQGISVSAYVSAMDTVTVRFQNESGGTINLASGTVKVQAWS